MTRFGFTIVGLALCIIAPPGCREIDVPPAGSYSEVLLVTEEGAADRFAREILPLLTKKLQFVIEEENQFDIVHMAAGRFPEVPVVKNIVFCGVADPLTDVGRRITDMLGDGGMEKVRQGTANIFKKENIPSPGQLTIIVTASTAESLSRILGERGDELTAVIEASCRERLRRFLLIHEDKSLTQYLFRKYGFELRVPTLYTLLGEGPDPPGVELLRDGPARLIGVYWFDWKHEPTLADSMNLFRARAAYVWERYDGDVMDSTRVHFSYAQLGSYTGIRMTGDWSNTRAAAGGYFESYFIYESGERLLWVVDLLAYAPGLPKHPLFREMLALAETFRYT